MKKVCEELAQTELFRDVNHEVFKPYCSRTNIRLYWKGEIVVNEGDRAEAVYIVVEGALAVQKYAVDGEYVTIDLLEAGDTFGEEFFFGNKQEYTYSVEAVSNAQVIQMSRGLVMSMMAEDESVQENFLGALSDRLRQMYKRINILSQRNLRLKISRYLLSLFEEQEQQSAADYTFSKMLQAQNNYTPAVELPVSKEVTAKLLAMPRPSFSRELVRMEKEGLIRVDDRTIWLLDIQALVTDGQVLDVE